jgi:hypothetical protein
MDASAASRSAAGWAAAAAPEAADPGAVSIRAAGAVASEARAAVRRPFPFSPGPVPQHDRELEHPEDRVGHRRTNSRLKSRSSSAIAAANPNATSHAPTARDVIGASGRGQKAVHPLGV